MEKDKTNNQYNISLDIDQIHKIQTNPKSKWFNSIVVILLTIMGISIGIIIGCLLIIFL